MNTVLIKCITNMAEELANNLRLCPLVFHAGKTGFISADLITEGRQYGQSTPPILNLPGISEHLTLM